MIRATRARRGTTLVELLVAAAMLMLGMWLLVWLYQQGMASFLNSKAQADLTTQGRAVATVITRDLGSTIFLDEDAKPNRGRRVSDQRTDQVASGWIPPRGGFFSAHSLPYGCNANDVYEATDSDGFVSARATDHWLQFSILLSGGPNYQLIGAEVPVGTGTQYFGTAAEVSYGLVPNGLTTAGGYPLYDLVRRQRLTAQTSDDTTNYQTIATNGIALGDNVSEVMTVSSGTMLNLTQLTTPSNRLPQAQWPLSAATSHRYGEERLMTNVLSFEVKFTGPTANLGAGAWPSDHPSTQWPRPLSGPGLANTDYPYDYLPFDGNFDTYTNVANLQNQVATVAAPTNPIKPIRLTGILIRLRAYDVKNQTTRQTTISSHL